MLTSSMLCRTLVWLLAFLIVTRHWRKHQAGEATSTNSIAYVLQHCSSPGLGTSFESLAHLTAVEYAELRSDVGSSSPGAQRY